MNFWTWLFQRTKPKPPVVVPPVRTMAVSVWSGGQAVTNATGVLDDEGRELVAVNQGGRLVFTLPPDLPYGWLRSLHIEAEGFVPLDVEVTLATSVDVTLSPVIRRVILPKLSIVGNFFRAGGQRWTCIGCSDFALYARWLNGKDIAPILSERQALGFNLVRVWLLNVSVYRIVPSDWGDRFYTSLVAFCDLCAQYGLYVQFTALTQTKPLMEDGAQQQAHLNRIDWELRDQTCLLEGGNEINNSGAWGNNYLWAGLARPPYGLWSHGSMAGDPGDNPPQRPTWGHSCIHSFSASGEWQRTVGIQAGEESAATGEPCLANENCRFIDNDSSAMHAYDAAACAAMLSAGSVFHSQRGKVSEPMQECAAAAKAWCDGAKSVPLEFQDGAWVHRKDLEKDGILRVYGSRLPDGREHDVVIHK